MLPSITTEIMRNKKIFTDAQNLWRKSRFHELGIRRMPSFFSLICTLVSATASLLFLITSNISIGSARPVLAKIGTHFPHPVHKLY